MSWDAIDEGPASEIPIVGAATVRSVRVICRQLHGGFLRGELLARTEFRPKLPAAAPLPEAGREVAPCRSRSPKRPA